MNEFNELMAYLQKDIAEAIFSIDDNPRDYLATSNRLRGFALDLAEEVAPAYAAMNQFEADLDEHLLPDAIAQLRELLNAASGHYELEPFRETMRRVEAAVEQAVEDEVQTQNSVLSSASRQAAMTVRAAVRDPFNSELASVALQVMETARSYVVATALYRTAAIGANITLTQRQIAQACDTAAYEVGHDMRETLAAAIKAEAPARVSGP